MKPFRGNLVLVINKYLCILHISFPGIDSISNEQVLSGMSKYNSYHNCNYIFDWIGYFISTQIIIEVSIHFYIWFHSTDESDKEEYMEFLRNWCICFIP